jgi:hypothetical protein
MPDSQRRRGCGGLDQAPVTPWTVVPASGCACGDDVGFLCLCRPAQVEQTEMKRRLDRCVGGVRLMLSLYRRLLRNRGHVCDASAAAVRRWLAALV